VWCLQQRLAQKKRVKPPVVVKEKKGKYFGDSKGARKIKQTIWAQPTVKGK
jgi:hypothetical protein